MIRTSLSQHFRPVRLVRAFILGLTFFAAACVASNSVQETFAAPPEPDPVPRRWQLDFVPGPLRLAQIDVAGMPRLYFYMTYKVTNGTAEDLLFAPSFELGNDQGGLNRSGRDIPAAVTQKLLDSLGNPLLQDQIGILGVLLQGEANAKEGLIAWPAESLAADQITVYAAGFSGENRSIEVKDPETGAIKKVLLRKTLMMRFKMPGSLQGQGSKPLEMIEKRWILR